MNNTPKILITGSKEYPLGTNRGDDPLPSGGIEFYIQELTSRLSNRNLNFIIITRKFKNTQKYEKKDNNIEVYRVPWLRGFYFRNISYNFMAFIKALSLEFDIIFSQDIFATLFGIILSKIKKKPIIGVVHGKSSEQPQYNRVIRFLLSKLEKFVFSRVNLVLCLTDKNLQDFRNITDKICVIPIGIDLNKFYTSDKEKFKKKLGLDGKVIITFVGRLLKVKGVEYLIDALKDIDREFLCLIVGSGKDEKHLKNMVKKYNLESRVKFLGFRHDIPDILKATDIFVLPSVSEGLSLSLLEAKAAGCACVVSNIGLPVIDNVTGIVFEPGNSKSLKNAILKLIDSPELRNFLGKNARNEAAHVYSWNRIIDRYTKLFVNFTNYLEDPVVLCSEQ